MPHIMTFFDREYLGAWDLQGRDCVVTVARVECKELVAQGNKRNKKPVIYFEGKEKGLACNKTNAKTISALYGNDTAEWVGKRITLYPTTTDMAGETKECIRVRPVAPPPAPEKGGSK